MSRSDRQRERDRLGKLIASLHHDELVDYVQRLHLENVRLRDERGRLLDGQLEIARALAREVGT